MELVASPVIYEGEGAVQEDPKLRPSTPVPL